MPWGLSHLLDSVALNDFFHAPLVASNAKHNAAFLSSFTAPGTDPIVTRTLPAGKAVAPPATSPDTSYAVSMIPQSIIAKLRYKMMQAPIDTNGEQAEQEFNLELVEDDNDANAVAEYEISWQPPKGGPSSAAARKSGRLALPSSAPRNSDGKLTLLDPTGVSVADGPVCKLDVLGNDSTGQATNVTTSIRGVAEKRLCACSQDAAANANSDGSGSITIRTPPKPKDQTSLPAVNENSITKPLCVCTESQMAKIQFVKVVGAAQPVTETEQNAVASKAGATEVAEAGTAGTVA